jgi:succinyl-diaminopimelate desuccinylase
MKINFKEEVLKREKEIIADLTKLIQINSELTTFDPKREGAPFGHGIKEAYDFMLGLGKRDGFSVVDVDGYAGHIEYGDQKEYVGMMGHLDVVPAGNDWTYPPYGAEIHDGKMYGRGTEDDKGPTIAAYYAMKILKELNVPLSKRVKLIIGNDEETAWRCVRHYFSVYPEIPVSGFIPDADFPLIYAEKGITRIILNGKLDINDVVSFNGGFRDNMVPDYAEVVFSNISYEKEFKAFLKENKYEGTTTIVDNKLICKVTGISAHGSTPEFGDNAIFKMVIFFNKLKSKSKLIEFINNYLLDDTEGKKLGLNYIDAEMGALTNNLGVLKTTNGNFEINLNLRYPKGVDLKNVMSTIEEKAKKYNIEVILDKHQTLLYTDPKSDLIEKLMAVYIKHTGDKDAKPITIGGGTFARAMPNTVAFGPHFLDQPTYIHQKNEFIGIKELLLATIIYTEALYELAK